MCQAWYKPLLQIFSHQIHSTNTSRVFYSSPISQIMKLRPWKWSDLPKGTFLVIVEIGVIYLFSWLPMSDPVLGAEDSKWGAPSLSFWDFSNIWSVWSSINRDLTITLQPLKNCFLLPSRGTCAVTVVHFLLPSSNLLPRYTLWALSLAPLIQTILEMPPPTGRFPWMLQPTVPYPASVFFIVLLHMHLFLGHSRQRAPWRQKVWLISLAGSSMPG